jgi:hypothetical protein
MPWELRFHGRILHPHIQFNTQADAFIYKGSIAPFQAPSNFWNSLSWHFSSPDGVLTFADGSSFDYLSIVGALQAFQNILPVHTNQVVHQVHQTEVHGAGGGDVGEMDTDAES